MKVMTIVGTRPELIRLSIIIGKLDRLCDHTLVHTGQNYEEKLFDAFLKEMGVRQPDHEVRRNTRPSVSDILGWTEAKLIQVKPDRVLILGDTNSGLSAIMAQKMGIPVYHMEAGNRCYEDIVPEEVNRRIIDHCSNVLMPYTERSRSNLLAEGINSKKIYVIGNPIYEILEYYQSAIADNRILEINKYLPQNYILVTAHRAETVDNKESLKELLATLDAIGNKYQMPVLFSLHPRTQDKIKQAKLTTGKYVKLHWPFTFFEFVTLERNAYCVVTDSGTVQEECNIYLIPSVTIRNMTERPETIESGGNILCGTATDSILRGIDVAMTETRWDVPQGYKKQNVSGTVAKILLGV